MRITSLLLLLGSPFLFHACNQAATNKQETASTQHTDGHVEQATTHNNPLSIHLIDGQKWLVNDEMKPYVSTGAKLVNDFVNQNRQDYAVLAKEIGEQNQLLIKSCTMEGESHDELHKWLHPHLELVKALEKSRDQAQSDSLVQALVASYNAYSQYFE
jgi:hypothetical protein